MELVRQYGVQATIPFPLIDAGDTDFEDTPVTFAAGDCKVSKDYGAFANTTNAPTHLDEGIYTVVLTATEMQAAAIIVIIKDQDGPAWEDQAVLITTKPGNIPRME